MTHGGAFDDDYYNWDGITANDGKLYVCGNPTGQPTLYGIPFSPVTSVNVTTQGAGYSSIPTPVFTAGGGTGAAGAAAVGVASIAVNPGGFFCTNGTQSFDVHRICAEGRDLRAPPR